MERTFGAEHEMGVTLNNKDFFCALNGKYPYDYSQQDEIDILNEFFLEGMQRHDSFQRNGGKLGIDMYHVEYSTPECISPEEAALYVHGTDLLFHMKVLNLQARNIPIKVYRDNTDWHEGFYAMHENYLVVTPVNNKANFNLSLVAYLATQPIWGGAGVIDPMTGEVSCSVQAVFDPETYRGYALKLMHGSEEQENTYARLEIRGEANGLHEITFLKFAITSLVLSMLESEFMDWDEYIPEGDGFIYAERLNSLVGDIAVMTLGGNKVTALEAQQHFASSIKLFLDYRSLTGLGVPTWAYAALERFQAVLEQIDTFMKTGTCQAPYLTDWLCKKYILDEWRLSGMKETEDVRRALCMAYHDTNPEESLLEGLYVDGKAIRYFATSELLNTISFPGKHPRANARSKEYYKLKGKKGVEISWRSVSVDGHITELPFSL